MDTEKNEDHKFYLSVWRQVLCNLLECNVLEADRWIELNCKPWDAHYAAYVSDFPEAWVVGALISDQTWESIGANNVEKLKRDIVHAIGLGKPKWSSNNAYDWPAAQKRVKDVFANYGQTMTRQPYSTQHRENIASG